MNKKALVAYFSCTGVTKNVAAELAKAADADLYEIKPEIPYTPADLNWGDKSSRSSVEMRDPASRPALSSEGRNADIAAYETIFLGFPVWWYIAPTIVNTFLESGDFSGKTIILFATSGGSGFGRTLEKLKGSVSPTTVLKEGKILNGRPSADELKKWVKNFE